MNLVRNEIRTGLLVVLTLGGLVALLIYVGAPGVFVPQHTLHVYFENAWGIKPGSDVLLAGRRIGQVARIVSPVPETERPDLKFEVLIDVSVEADARLYRGARAYLVQTSLLGDPVIDFNGGREAGGVAPDGTFFQGERVPGLNDAVPQVLAKIDPALRQLTETLATLQQASENLTLLTAEGGDLTAAFAEYRKFGLQLNEVAGPDGSLRHSLKNLETLTGPEGRLDKVAGNLEALTGSTGPLASTLEQTRIFTRNLAANGDLPAGLRNLRRASDKLDRAADGLGPQLNRIGGNLEQASDTVKRQPWRLIWPATKKYPEDRPKPVPPVRRVPAPAGYSKR